jgi:iron complex outermembrane recepter protein
LYSAGAHHATEAFEIGNPELDDETAVGFELILRRTTEKVSAQVTGYHTRFSDYIYLSDTGSQRDGDGNKPPAAGEEALDERIYKGVSAKFYGIEAEVDWLAMENADWSLVLSAQGDLVRAKNTSDNANLPRTPPATLGVGFDILRDKMNFGMNLTRAMKQDDLAPNEAYTAGYSLLDAYASYDLDVWDSLGEVFVRGHNLTDELAQVHTSFRKPDAPLPGRSVEIGLKFDF